MSKVLAVNVNGDITYCTCTPEMRGTGRCNHVDHQRPGESPEEFINRINEDIKEENIENDHEIVKNSKEITQDEINNIASKIDEIAGVKLTPDNWKDVLTNLPADKVAEITKLSFKAAPTFSLPISDEHYEDENMKNKLYFANLPAYGVSGNMDSIKQMFDKVGSSITLHGEEFVDHSYKEGLTPHEYFTRFFTSRSASINKTVDTAHPGYCIYAKSLVEIKDINDNLTKVKWEDINIGDEFTDGSIVVEIRDWQKKPCYRIKLRDYDEIILSYDHLVYGDIIVNNKVVDNLEKSEKARWNVQESDKKWICMEDIYEFYKLGAKIKLNDFYDIEYVKPYKNFIPQQVRCITSSTGYFETNGLIHHNTARKLFYGLSDMQVVDDCGGPYIDALHCKAPEGHVCVKCAHLTKGGERIKQGDLIGGFVSTNISEALTQLSMKQMHVGSKETANQIHGSATIMNTLDGFSSSPIIREAKEAQTTEEMRKIMYEGLKKLYKESNIKQDDINLQMVARKLTSYKRSPDGLRPIKEGEKADIVSLRSIGNCGNVFKASELSTGYKFLTKPNTQKINHKDAANQILN